MSEQLACYVADVEKGTALLTDLTLADGTDIPVAIVHTKAGEIFAINDTCTHGEVSLSEGEVTDNYVECWAHGSRFDLRTGEPDELPAVDPIPTYPVRIDGERVLVDVDSPIVISKENA